jgi:hypothetical protein
VIVTGQVTGNTTVTLNNSTLIVEGGSNSSPSAASTVTVNMQSGTDTVDLAYIGTGSRGATSNNLTINGVVPGDSIGVEGLTSATITNTGPTNAYSTFTVAGAKGAVETNLASVSELGSNYYPNLATDTINGNTFDVATFDPPASGAANAVGQTNAQGSTRSRHDRQSTSSATGGNDTRHGQNGVDGLNAEDSSGDTRERGAADTTLPVNHETMLGSWDKRFLHRTNGPATDQASASALQRHVAGGLASDLTNVNGSRGGRWTSDGEKGRGISTPHDRHADASFGGVSENSSSHHNGAWWLHR